MTLFYLATLLIVLAALFSFINTKLLKLPTTIGVMLLALATSLVLMAAGRTTSSIGNFAHYCIVQIDFEHLVLHVMLAFLLFAGALPLNLGDLRREAALITLLALAGTALSTLMVAALFRLAFHFIGPEMPWVFCFLFGALISPTDPIAVLGIMKSVGAPRRLETKLAGESLFNDGVGVVIFLTVLDYLGGAPKSPSEVAMMLAAQISGGVAVGLACGIIVYFLLKLIDHYHVEVLMTLALAMGAFAIAEIIHVSAPIAAVVAGLVIGNGRARAMSATSREHLDMFWEFADEVLNAVLFLLLGLQMLVIPLEKRFLLTGAAAIVIALLARYVSVAGLIYGTGLRRKVLPGTVAVLTWCGLRGGLSVAMALSLPRSTWRDTLVACTYAVVIFAVFIQGITAKALVKRVARGGGEQRT